MKKEPKISRAHTEKRVAPALDDQTLNYLAASNWWWSSAELTSLSLDYKRKSQREPRNPFHRNLEDEK